MVAEARDSEEVEDDEEEEGAGAAAAEEDAGACAEAGAALLLGAVAGWESPCVGRCSGSSLSRDSRAWMI